MAEVKYPVEAKGHDLARIHDKKEQEMKEKLLFDWKQKYERIQWELKDNEKKLENVMKRRKMLFGNFLFQIFFCFSCVMLLFFMWQFRETVSYIEYGAFYPFYLAAIYGLLIAAIIYNGYQFGKQMKKYFYHTVKLRPVEYPKPEMAGSNYPTHIPLNYYEERACIEWLLHQYTEMAGKLIALRRKIENTPEQNLEPLREELESIMIYERVGRAKS